MIVPAVVAKRFVPPVHSPHMEMKEKEQNRKQDKGGDQGS